jgi:SacI-like restriction endonuclease
MSPDEKQKTKIDYDGIRKQLDIEFAGVGEAVMKKEFPSPPDEGLKAHFDVIFASGTQAYREVLVGCVLAKSFHPETDVHKPYIQQAPNAYSGRTLDERVVNPFLHDNRIPSSRGPFLSTFRRNVAFEPRTRDGVRDKEGFDALLSLVDYVDDQQNAKQLASFLRYLLYRFIQLREAAEIQLVRLQRVSLEQYGALIEGLLNTPSGGRFPVMMIEAALVAISEAFGLNWRIEVQGINEADRAGGAGGDITVRRGEQMLLAAEVTERPIERNRVVATFQTKIAPNAIEDYLFFIKDGVGEDVMRQARQYFAQGHEINFLDMKHWLLTILATISKAGRDRFNLKLIEKLQEPDVPAALKVAWNEQIEKITAA